MKLYPRRRRFRTQTNVAPRKQTQRTKAIAQKRIATNQSVRAY